MKSRFAKIFLGIILLAYGCDAPRNNPLDPYNPNFINWEVSNFNVYSVSYYPIDDEEKFRIGCTISLGYTDIDSAFIYAPSIDFRRKLQNDADGEYSLDIQYGEDIDKTVGEKFYLITYKDKESYKADSSSVVRVIRDNITLDSPINSATLNDYPYSFNWDNLQREYSFHYVLEIITVPDDSTIYTETLNKSTTSVEVRFGIGEFKWRVWVVDEYNNQRSSLSGSFRIEE